MGHLADGQVMSPLCSDEELGRKRQESHHIPEVTVARPLLLCPVLVLFVHCAKYLLFISHLSSSPVYKPVKSVS